MREGVLMAEEGSGCGEKSRGGEGHKGRGGVDHEEGRVQEDE